MRKMLRLLALLLACSLGGNSAESAADNSVNNWSRLGNGPGERMGSMLLHLPDSGSLLLLGGESKEKGAPVEMFALTGGQWSQLATNISSRPIHPYYQAAYYPKKKKVYCLSNGSILYSFDTMAKKWLAMPSAPELEGLSWHAMACDPQAGRLVVIGADKRIENVGWSRTVVYDIASEKWEPLALPNEKTVTEHRELVALIESTIDLVGRIRLAWYRAPKGTPSDSELQTLIARCTNLAHMPGTTAFRSEFDQVLQSLKASQALEALKAARLLQRTIEERAFAQYPVPPSRRNAPLVYDEQNRVFVLFGGDHEDYQMNDTWILDLQKQVWRRAKPERAPSPRAGHAMVYLPKCGRIAMYEGYAASSDPSYGAGPAQTLSPRELWLYDVKTERWELMGAWAAKGNEKAGPPNVGSFYGYSSSWFAVPPVAADGQDQLYLVTPERKQDPSAIWKLPIDPAQPDITGGEKLGQLPNQRRLRDPYFRADYCEVPDEPKQLDLAGMPPNQWVRFPKAPRTPASGCRQRDWGTAVWDSDRDQILLWGGGHCVRSSSVVLHFSPGANRFAEGYDADEPYCYNGFCGPGSSLLNRQWIDCHGYNLYAYDPKNRSLVTARGFLYDPERMDWIRTEAFPAPFAYTWGHVVIESSAHGAVAWAKKMRSDDYNLWLFDREKGWVNLEPKGKLHPCWCDSDGMVYDAKRDRMLLGWGGGYGKRGDGTITAFDFKTKVVEKIMPENLDLGKTRGTRELVYVPQADLVLFGSEAYTVGDKEKGKRLTRVYDCGKNRYYLLDGGPVDYGHSAGWVYDPKRRCAYVINFRGECWAMRIDPATLSLLDKAPQSGD